MTTLAAFSSADYLDSGGYGRDQSAERVTDLRERIKRAGFSRRHDHPLEKPAQPQVGAPVEACGTVHLYRLENGRLMAIRVDCRTKACRKCGPRLRAQYAAGCAQVLADRVVYRLVIDGRDWRKLQVRLGRRGADYLRIPGPDATLVVWTAADLGPKMQPCDLVATLADDFDAMPTDAATSAPRPTGATPITPGTTSSRTLASRPSGWVDSGARWSRWPSSPMTSA